MGDHRWEERGGTLLTVRAHLADLGARPVFPSWQSPDIYERGGEITEVAVGVPLQLVALVSNFGTEPAYGVRVDFWWADSGLGISMAAAKPIGTSAIGNVSVGDAVEFPCAVPWVPQSVSANAHPCLVVQASGLNCPVVQPFRPDIDSQVGQRNLTIKPAGGQFKLIAFNPFAEPAPARIVARSLRIHGEALRELPLGMLLAADVPEVRTKLREQHISVRGAGGQALRLVEVADIRSEGEGERDGTSASREGVSAGGIEGRTIGEFELPARGTATLVFDQDEPRAEVGEALVHQLVQIVGGIQVGGYSFVAL